VALVASTASFHQKLTELDVSINPGTQITHPGLPMLDGSSRSPFQWFLALFLSEAVEAILWHPN